jgi:hypothetical protein
MMMNSTFCFSAARRMSTGLLTSGFLLAFGGCATGGGVTGEPTSAPALSGRPFYADWYEASAVVLPPPPAELPVAKDAAK